MKLDPRLKRLFDNWPAKMLCFAAAVALFFFNRFNRLVEKNVVVPVRVVLNGQYVPASEYPEEINVQLRGEGNAIGAISDKDLVAVLDLSQYQAEGTYKVGFSVERSGNALDADPLELSLTPAEAAVAIEKRLSKTVPIEPVFQGYLESGYEIERIELVPDRVEVSGPASKVNATRSVPTEVIELGGRLGNFTASGLLSRESKLVELSGAGAVLVNIYVRKATATRTFDNVRIEAINARPGLAFSFDPAVGTLTLNGPQLELDALEASALLLTVDAGSIDKPGSYELALRADPPSAFALEGFGPEKVTVTVTLAPGVGG